MRYRALACDYDGTLATNSRVDTATVNSLRQWVAAGRKLLLVTGRELPELKTVLPELDLFHSVVAENGGLLYIPATGETRAVAAAPPREFVSELISRGVGPISVGHSIVATWQPHENTVLNTIKDLGLELQVIFNKGAVMILPSGVNKATGLAAALLPLELSRHGVVAIGDAENDHAFLNYCRVGVAVDNALPALKQRAEIVTRGDHGRGVQELIARLLKDDLVDVPTPSRHKIALGSDNQRWSPGEEHLVITADADTATATTEEIAQKLANQGFQYVRFTCAVQPPSATSPTLVGSKVEAIVGSSDQLPTADEVAQLLIRPDQSVRVMLCAHSPDDRRHRFSEIWKVLQTFQEERGHPHAVMLPSPGEATDLQIKLPALLKGIPSGVILRDRAAPAFTIDVPYQSLDARVWRTTSPTNSAP